MNRINELASKVTKDSDLVEYTRLIVDECLGVMESCGKVLPAGSKPAMIYVRERIQKHFFSIDTNEKT